MLGAIIGDIVGSIYEFNNIRTKEFELFDSKCFFTDDTAMSVAISQALIDCKGNYANLSNYAIKRMQEYGKKYPNLGYGGGFRRWLRSDNPTPYNSFGNGSAMRVSSTAYFASNIDEVKELSKKVTEITHNHPEGIKGAEATAVAIYLALQNKSKKEIIDYIENNYYSLNFDYEELKVNYKFNETCQDTVPQALYCFKISNSFEDAIRTGISIGGDSDTLCAIIGAIAEAYYGIPNNIKEKVFNYLDNKLINDYNEFCRYTIKNNKR